MSGIELISDQQVVKDLETIKSLITCFHGIQDSIYPSDSESNNYHKTFLQIVQDSTLLDPQNDVYTLSETHPVVLDKRAAIQYEIDKGGNPNKIRALHIDLMDIQKTIEKAEISLISAAR
jgi:hypothetical protein